MTRPNTITIVSIIAILMAGSASLLVYNYLKSQTETRKQSVAIVSAARDIAVGTKLDTSHLKLVSWPKEALAAGYLTDTNILPGRVAVKQMSAGDIVTEAKLMPLNASSTGGIMTYIVPQGHRAVTVGVNEVAGVAGFISPGNRVDVVLTTPRPGSADKEDYISKIILQNVPVLASGQGTEQKEGKPVIVPTVTLDLNPEDAEKLIVAVGAKKGSLQLLLRSVVDTAEVDTKGATISNALNVAVAPIVKTTPHKVATARKVVVQSSAPAVQAKLSVEILKGSMKTTREFPIQQ